MKYRNSIDLSNDVRGKVIPLLQARLADAIDLQSQAKQAHWNVKGPSFISLHQLFDQVAEHAEAAVDELAERIVQLGGVAEGTVRAAAARSTLGEYPFDIATGMDHVRALTLSLATFGKGVRQAIDAASQAGDADTADLFTEISRAADKDLWFVEAHLQAER